MQQAQKIAFIDAMGGIFKPRPAETVVEWSERSLVLDTKATAFAGPYSTSMTPYVREILNAFADGNVGKVVCCFGAQTAKTQTFMAGLSWILANEPSPTMWVMPNKELAESFSDTRLRPMLDSCVELVAMRSTKRRPKKTEFEYDGSILTLVGSNSPANLSSRPVRVLILDEVDKYPQKTNKEAAAIKLAQERTMSFPESKIFESSTPTTTAGEIWQEFLNGDQRRYFVPCPHCGKHIILMLNPERTAFDKLQGCEAKLSWNTDAKREDGTWDYDRVALTAHYVCPHCGGKIGNEAKSKMLRSGEWRPTNPYADKGIRSYHLPTFYAPWRKASWGELAVEFLEAKHSVGGLRNFINSKCAEPDAGQYDGGAMRRRERIILDVSKLSRPNERATIMTVDVQKDHFWYVVREWYTGGDSLLVKWGRCDTFDDLREISETLKADIVGIDDGYEASKVGQECARFSHWICCRGDDRESWPFTTKKGKRVERPFSVRQFDPMLGTANAGRKYVTELRWSNPTVKDILARLRQSDTAPVKWSIPNEYATDEYFKHLNGEWKKRIVSLKTGRATMAWVLRSSLWPNHLLDCECMNLAIALKFEILKNINGKEEE